MPLSDRLRAALPAKDYYTISIAIWARIFDGMLVAAQPILAVWAVTQSFLGNGNIDLIILLSAAFMIVLVLRRLVLWPLTCHINNHAYNFGLAQRRAILQHLIALPMGAYQRLNKGKVSQTLSEDMMWLETYVSFTWPQAISDFVLFFSLLAAAFWMSWQVALGAVFALAIALTAILILRRKLQKDLRTRSKNMSHSAEQVIEFVQGMLVLRSFGSTYGAGTRFEQSIEKMQRSFRRGVISGTPIAALYLAAIQASIGLAMLVGVLLLTTPSAETRSIIPDLGPVIGSIILLTACILPIRSLMALNGMQILGRIAQENLADIESIAPLADTQQAITVGSSSLVEFDNVSFRYEKDANQALKHIRFEAAEGSLTAIVGRSGAGKSTLMHLLMRFWDVEDGIIRLGGTDIRKIGCADLLDQIATVFQETILFHDSIANNLKIGKPDATNEEIHEAAKAAQIHDFICSLPEGYDTLVGVDGANLSGGQQQRLAIARAILKNAPIIILDEATSALDPENEAAIQSAFLNLARNKTVFVIAHRLSTITEANQILVLDDGHLVGRGQHQALLENCSVYQTLWANYEASKGWRIS